MHILQLKRDFRMAIPHWTDSLLQLKRANVLGAALGIIGITVALTPEGTFGISTYVQQTTGLTPLAMGVLMSIGGWLILLLNIRLIPYIVCTLPWAVYTLCAAFFVLTNHLSATVAVAYLLIYALIVREAFDLA